MRKEKRSMALPEVTWVLPIFLTEKRTVWPKDVLPSVTMNLLLSNQCMARFTVYRGNTAFCCIEPKVVRINIRMEGARSPRPTGRGLCARN